MKKEHTNRRRISTAILLLFFGVLFTIFSVLSIVKQESTYNIVFNIASTLICYWISYVLFTNKSEQNK